MLNSLMLYHAVKFGLDLAILNASKIIPITRIEEEDKKLFDDLIFNRRTAEYDPLKKFYLNFQEQRKIFNLTQQKEALYQLKNV